MDNSRSISNRVVSAVVAAMTLLWVAGAAAFAVPQSASAASAGDLVRGTSFSTVYFVGYDGSRYIFPNEKTYDTWFNGFTGVQTLSDAAVAAIPVAGNVVFRPGSSFIKITSAAQTYAVGADGSIHWIESEAVATGLAGSDWNKNISDVPDALFVDYTEGMSLTSAKAFDGALYTKGGSNYAVVGNQKHMLSAAAVSANNLESRFFLDGASIDDAALTAGSDYTGSVCVLTNAAQDGKCPVTGVATGNVTVSKATSSAAGATLPKGATSVPVFSFNVAAGSEAAEFNGVTLKFGGLAHNTDLSAVYLYDGATRLTESRSVNSSTLEATFGSLHLALAAGQSKTLTVRVEVSETPTVGDEFNFSISSATAVDASGTIGGSFPISGNTFKIGGLAVGTVTVTKNGSISNPSVGQVDAAIGQFKIDATNEDASVKEVTLKIDNATDHSNFKLWQGTTQIATGSYIGDKEVLFVLATPLTILDGNSKILKVTANIGGTSTDVITVGVKADSDIVATGADYGFGMHVVKSAYLADASCTHCSTSTIQGGDVTISTSGPATGDIAANTNAQHLLDFSLTSSQAITVKDMPVAIVGVDGDQLTSGTNNTLSNVKIVNTDTGRVVMGPLELDSDASLTTALATLAFTDDFEVSAGQTLHLAVVADVDQDTASGTHLYAKLLIPTNLAIEDANGDPVSSVVPSGDITGKTQQVITSSLSVSLATTPGDITIVKGMNNVLSGGFNFVGGDAGAVTVDSVKVAIYSADTKGTDPYELGDRTGINVGDYIASCSAYNKAGDLLDGPVAPTTDGNYMTFDNLNWSIAKSANERFNVKCNFTGPSTFYNSNGDAFAFDIVNSDDSSYLDIAAHNADNDVYVANVDVNGATTPHSTVLMNASGAVTTALDSSTPSSDIFLTGTTMNLASVFRVAATDESFTVNKLTVTETAGTAIAGSANGYTNNVDQVVLKYKNQAGTEKTVSQGFTGGTNKATFTGLDIYVGEGKNTLVSAYVDTTVSNRLSQGIAVSNSFLALGLSTASGDFNAVGASGVTTVVASSASAGRTHVVKETKPTVSVNASNPSGTKVPGTIETFRFNVAASSNEAVVVKQIAFQIDSTDNTGTPTDWNFCDTNAAVGTVLDSSDFTLYDLSNQGLSAALEAGNSDWTLQTADGADCTTTGAKAAFARLVLTTPVVVPAGTTHVFALYMNVSGASAANDDSVQVSIPSEGYVAVGSVLYANGMNEATTSRTDTTISVDDSTGISVGDVLAIDVNDGGSYDAAHDELVLVAGITGNDLTVVRGYQGSATAVPADVAVTDGIILMAHSSFVWEDDGDASTVNTGDTWGAYLVDSLPALPSTGISF